MQKRLKVKNQDQQQLLEFRREEAGKTGNHEKEITELYLKMAVVQQSNNFGMNFNQQSQMYNVRLPQNVQPPPPLLWTCIQNTTCIRISTFRSTFSIPY